MITYLRLTKQPVGLLINFGGATLKEGFRRLVNDYQPSASLRLRANQIPAAHQITEEDKPTGSESRLPC